MSKRWTFARHLECNVMPEPNSGCWLWHGWMNWAGYGRWRDDSGKEVLTHRASWEHHRGPIPDGLFVCHKCDVRCCVNPDHLFLGTIADNNLDMASKGRYRGTFPVCELNKKARLTIDQVVAIRSDRRSQKAIAAEYGIGPSTVWAIRSGKTWRGIERPEPGSNTPHDYSKRFKGTAPHHADKHGEANVTGAGNPFTFGGKGNARGH